MPWIPAPALATAPTEPTNGAAVARANALCLPGVRVLSAPLIPAPNVRDLVPLGSTHPF